MAEVNRPFTTLEQDALKRFVDSGKGIYFIADHYNADRNMNTWDSTETYNGYNRSISATYNMGGVYGDLRNPQDATKGWLSQNFGLRFRFNAINLIAGYSGIKSVTDSEGITQGVGPILMAAGSTLSIVDGNKAKGIVYLAPTDTPTKWGSAADQGLYFGGEAEGAYVAISKPSLGKAAFIGDSSPIEDITPKYKNEGSGSTKSLHQGYKNIGNAAVLSVNIINWLATPETYVGFDGINHTKGINTPIPLALMEKNQTLAEPWATPAYNPWITDTFAYGSYNAAQGPSSGSISSIVEGFNGVVGTSSSITSGIPSGWIFAPGMAVYRTTGNYGASAPSIKMQTSGNQITTPTFNLTAQGTLSFWIKGNGSDAITHLLVEKYDGTSWTTVQDISAMPTTGTIKTYTIAQSIKQVRFTFTKSGGNLAFDDINIR